MSNAVIESLLTRRSIRAYEEKQVDIKDLEIILKTGEYAPSGMGNQSPVLIGVQNKEIIEKLVKLNASIMGVDSNPYYDAPTIILVLADRNAKTHLEDGCCALENMMVAAHSLGLGSCWIHREYEMFNTKEGKEILKEMGVEGDLVGIGGLALGYPKMEGKAKPRKENYSIIIK